MWILVKWPRESGVEPEEVARFELLGELLGWVREHQDRLSGDWSRLRAVREEDGDVRHVGPLMLRYRDDSFREPGLASDSEASA